MPGGRRSRVHPRGAPKLTSDQTGPLLASSAVRSVDPPSTTTTSSTTTTTLPSSGVPVPAKLPDFPTMPNNGAVNCEADNYLIQNYDLAADARNQQAASLATAEKNRAAAEKELGTATGQQADNLRARI